MGKFNSKVDSFDKREKKCRDEEEEGEEERIRDVLEEARNERRGWVLGQRD